MWTGIESNPERTSVQIRGTVKQVQEVSTVSADGEKLEGVSIKVTDGIGIEYRAAFYNNTAAAILHLLDVGTPVVLNGPVSQYDEEYQQLHEGVSQYVDVAMMQVLLRNGCWSPDMEIGYRWNNAG